MSRSIFRPFFCTLLLLMSLGPVALAQPQAPFSTFDLVLVGDHLNADAHRVFLKTNPAQGEDWTAVDRSDPPVRCTGTDGLVVVPGLSVEQYVGQDIRENHLSLQIRTNDADANGALRAVYALPSVDSFDEETCTRLVRLVETEPSTVRRHSLAAYVRPRPVSLEAASPFIDNIELPVRHHKPGVLEVEWLEILYQQGE